MVTIEQIKQLREETGSSPTQIKKALEESKGDKKQMIRKLRKSESKCQEGSSIERGSDSK